ncbi:hypothetical protein Patl1_32501 [Pistacia atlantica]|uniref:Uncharacterized protein n=1 Tax=Pistacia atlantica TaxID=434234 RepID=A0ACC1AMK4_9ROSI|nr:hypothetical protein Patl1_32501 [Pistacia atlantica]
MPKLELELQILHALRFVRGWNIDEFCWILMQVEGKNHQGDLSGNPNYRSIVRPKEPTCIAMDYTSKRSQGGLFEGLYRVIMRRNSIYVTFIIAGAFAGERAVDYGVRKLWEYNNVGVIN